MPHLSELLKGNVLTRLQDSSQSYYINFVIMDLRLNKTGGFLPRSHLINSDRLKPESINSLVDEFGKLKGVCHFILMTSTFNSHTFNPKREMGSPLLKQRPQEENRTEGKYRSLCIVIKDS